LREMTNAAPRPSPAREEGLCAGREHGRTALTDLADGLMALEDRLREVRSAATAAQNPVRPEGCGSANQMPVRLLCRSYAPAVANPRLQPRRLHRRRRPPATGQAADGWSSTALKHQRRSNG
jgi:hypothetical protein